MKIKELLLNFIQKYKLETISTLIASCLVGFVGEQIYRGSKLYLCASILVLFAMGSFIVDKIFAISENNLKKAIQNKLTGKTERYILILKIISYIAITIICIVILGIYYSTNRSDYKSIFDLLEYSAENISLTTLLVTSLLTVVIMYLVPKEKKIDIKSYLLKVFMNTLYVSIVIIAIYIGFFILVYICEELLGGISYDAISKITVFITCFTVGIGFFISVENVEGPHSMFSKILVRYIMQPMVFLGYVIFYVYLFKIVLKWELPSNQVFSVVSVLFFVGLSISLMSLGIEDNSPYNKTIRYLPIAFMPALVLQIMSISLRINQYGLSSARYVGILIIIFEVVYLICYFFDEIRGSKKIKIEKSLLALCIIWVIIFLVPKLNINEFPEIYNKVFYKVVQEESTDHIESPSVTIKSPSVTSSSYRFLKEYLDVKGYSKVRKCHIRMEYDSEAQEEKWIYEIQTEPNQSLSLYKETDEIKIDFQNICDAIIQFFEDNADDESVTAEVVLDNIFEEIEDTIVIDDTKKFVMDIISIVYEYGSKILNRVTIEGFLIEK